MSRSAEDCGRNGFEGQRSRGRRSRPRRRRLVDAEGGHQLWAQRFDRELSDVLAIQDEIASTIVK